MLTFLVFTLSVSVQLSSPSPAIVEEVQRSDFQTAVQHCCTSTTSRTPHRYNISIYPHFQVFPLRCFEVNEFAGVNFVRSPCRFLKSVEKKTQMDPEEKKEMSAKLFKKLIETRQKEKIKVVSKFQSAVQNCCDNTESETPYRWNWL